jgi:hydrophobic/amphiphilic exporter-1 (mainly G- bacteria), HAE1 family
MIYDRRRGLIMCERAGRRGLIMSNPVCMATQLTDGFVTIAYAMLGAIGLVYLLLVPLVTFFALPLAVIGGFVSLAAIGHALGLSALIVLLMPRGIAVTDAIVLLDLAVAINATVLLDLVQHKIEAGADVCAELLQGGRTRLRPIPLTAAATILALIPLAPSNGVPT